MRDVDMPYPSFLRDTLRHAELLAEVIESIDPTSSLPMTAATWLIGRVDELECLVRALVADWRASRTTDLRAAQSIHRHLVALHSDLGTHFGELAPRCCILSARLTVSRTCFESPTAPYPVSRSAPSGSETVATAEIEDDDILDVQTGRIVNQGARADSIASP